MKNQKGHLSIHTSKETIPSNLHSLIHQSFLKAINSSSSTFHIAISGGSLPSFLVTLPQSFIDANIDPQWDKWHVLLADERLVPSTHEDSNLGALKEKFLDKIPIPKDQIYGINESLLGENSDPIAIAKDYQSRVFDPLLSHKDENSFLVDCALLGFGPDGHTCSLFAEHKLLEENDLLVAGITDSPKMPPKRITLTLKTLNKFTRDVIFVGAGESKSAVLKTIFKNIYFQTACGTGSDEIGKYNVVMNNESVYPCGMIRPSSDSLHYVTDASAAKTLSFNNRFGCSML